ncbi:MAG TPA: hemerythrin domain-containing protein [Patescibacteria group bacterium]|nr:hemerythrin domain-containing protein [Patescibacteria group bacterium]
MKKSTAKKKTEAEMKALSLLAKDFGSAMQNFREFARVVEKDDDNIDRKVEIVTQTCADVMTHLQVREDIFYPAVKEATGDERLVNREISGNETVKQLIKRLTQLEPGDELYDATFIVLGETVAAHVKAEQQILFPEARAAGLDDADLARKIQKREAELKAREGIEEQLPSLNVTGHHSDGVITKAGFQP